MSVTPTAILFAWFAFDVAVAPFAVMLARRLARECVQVPDGIDLGGN